MAKEKEDWISIEDAAHLTGYTGDYVRKLAKAKKITARKIVIVWQVSQASLLKYKEEMDTKGEKRGRKTNA